jgi:hypothetical protein
MKDNNSTHVRCFVLSVVVTCSLFVCGEDNPALIKGKDGVRYAFSEGLLLSYKDSADKPLWKIDVSSPKWSFEYASSCWEKICKAAEENKYGLETALFEDRDRFYNVTARLPSFWKQAMERKKETALGGGAAYVSKEIFLSGDYVWLKGAIKLWLGDFGETYSPGWLCVNKKTGVIENAIPQSFSLVSYNEGEALFEGVGKKVLYLYSTNGIQVVTDPLQVSVSDVRVPFDEWIFVRDERSIQGKLYTLVTVAEKDEPKERMVMRYLPQMRDLIGGYGRSCTAVVFGIRQSAESRNVISTSFGMEEVICLSRMSKDVAEAKVKNEHVWAKTIFPDRPTW